MAQKSNILFILPFLPYPLVSGGHQAIFNGIYAIRNDVNVFITYKENIEKEHIGEMERLIRVMDGKIEVLPFIVCHQQMKQRNSVGIRRRFSNKIWLFQQWLNKFIVFDEILPTSIKPCTGWIKELQPCSNDFLEYVNDIIKRKRIDIVQVETLPNISFVQSISKNVRTLFVHHEIGFVRHKLEISSDNSLEEKMYLEQYRMVEVALLNKYNGVVSLSLTDTEKLRKAGVKVPIYTSFAIVNTSGGLEKALLTKYNVLSFVGPQFHEPNRKGLIWFLQNCWGKLLESDSSYTLQIIGKWKEDQVEELTKSYNRIKFLGFVDDLPKAIKNSIMIVPITIGSGIRMKILEAATIGVPIVSTTVGIEGIPLVNGEGCYISDTPEGFVDAIIKLKDFNIRQKFVKEARLIVEKNFSMDSFRKNRLIIYDNLLNNVGNGVDRKEKNG